MSTAVPPVEPGRLPVHRRTITFDAYDEGEHLTVVGRLRDERPWAENTTATAQVHDIELRVQVGVADLVISAATADMHVFPHAECPRIEEAFGELVGLSVGRGYTRQVQERFAGPRGCTHLDQLARTLGPVVIQALTSRRGRAMLEGGAESLMGEGGRPFATNTCHIWAEGGVAEQKLALGWRPGRGPYPAPPVDELEAGAAG